MFSARRLLLLAALAATLVPAAAASAASPTQVPARTYTEGQSEALPVPLRCPPLVDRCDWRFFPYDESARSGSDFLWPDAGVRMSMRAGQHGGVYLPMDIRHDGISEGTETFRVRAFLTVVTTSGMRLQQVDDARMTILDADPAPQPGISVVRPPVCLACTPIQVKPVLPG